MCTHAYTHKYICICIIFIHLKHQYTRKNNLYFEYRIILCSHNSTIPSEICMCEKGCRTLIAIIVMIKSNRLNSIYM